MRTQVFDLVCVGGVRRATEAHTNQSGADHVHTLHAVQADSFDHPLSVTILDEGCDFRATYPPSHIAKV